MKEITITRKFSYNGISLACPNAGLTPDQVREFYATQYPELNNAVVEGPVTKNNASTYTFQRAAGAKGRGPENSPLRTQVMLLAAGVQTNNDQLIPDEKLIESMGGPYRVLNAVGCSKQAGRAMKLPSGAFGIWG